MGKTSLKTSTKKVISTALLFVMLLGILNLKTYASAKEFQGTPVYSILKADFTMEDFVNEGYSEEFITELFTAYGWVMETDHMYRIARVQAGEIGINGVVYTFDENALIDFDPTMARGVLNVSGVIDNAYVSNSPIEATTKDSQIATFSDNIQAKSDTAIVVELNFGDLMDLMDKKEAEMYQEMRSGEQDFYPPAHGTKKYSAGDTVHCNRFNGPATDHYHYSKTSPKAIVNFAGSDCDYSLGNCLFCITAVIATYLVPVREVHVRHLQYIEILVRTARKHIIIMSGVILVVFHQQGIVIALGRKFLIRNIRYDTWA